ncbi:MAG TPA: SAM-dependent methyltransferase [Chthoniobacterales bacterium]|nr:SAM-dependent methyltransferase [Chthoniobacterales bacterium]
MPTGNPVLIDFLRETMRGRGPVSFAWFMEQALYHPEHGYYSSGRAAIGRGGDYFTSVSVGPLFGRLLAAQFCEIWEALGRRAGFAIVEQGAHGGDFAHDVLTAAQRQHPDFFEALSYQIVEPFPILAARQAAALSAFRSKVRWHDSLLRLPPFCGVHFSNELLDAMPVHLVHWTGTEWRERHVSVENGEFAFVNLPVTDEALAKHLRKIPLPLPVGYETEVNLAALRWVEAVAPRMEDGVILIADYGWPRDEFYSPARTTGTLSSYAEHQRIPNPLTRIGEADLTAHVEWTSVAEGGAAAGLTVTRFADQHRFITGLLADVVGHEFNVSTDEKTKRALQTLLQPSHLGMKFQFLALARDDRIVPRLSGFRFARNAETALGSDDSERKAHAGA